MIRGFWLQEAICKSGRNNSVYAASKVTDEVGGGHYLSM